MNKKILRSGTLFKVKIKSKHIADPNYFIWVIKYILENHVKANFVQKITDLEFSNASDLLSLRKGTLTNSREVRSFFQSEIQMPEFLVDTKIKVNYEF
ncbi:MAG: hypothetical protein KJ799_11880 [Bacteroidetes bacterium]|nr:hypothetical protein [Bacteroidota bacterium]MBU1679144.1 hypothetical protein [Bacteroidota bacterium]MBU2507403.1 hypothetical protein [Bacteroidota bacterium]